MNKVQVTSDTSLLDLPGIKWSSRARKVFAAVPHRPSIFNFYLWHAVHNGGNVPTDIGNVAEGTYNKIGRVLIDSGFPDPRMDVFGYGYVRSETTRKSLRVMLDSWKNAPHELKVLLEKEFGSHWTEGA